MSVSGRDRRLLLAVLVVGGLSGWKWYAAQPAIASTPDESAAAPAAVRRLGQLAFSPCALASEFGVQTVEAQCSSLEVPEDRATPGGRKIGLALAWVPATGPAEPDPVFYLAGGPGQSALQTYPDIAAAFADTLEHRNLILVDQRGTGGSNKLACRDDSADPRAAAERCLEELSEHADVRFYSTTDAIQDLDDVRSAVGAEKINLYGVSYGTRVALQYAKRYPERIRTLTLDGVVPDALVLGNEFAGNLENSLDRQFARCAADPACAGKLGDPRARLDTLLARLETDPPLVRYRDAITGEERTETLTAVDVAMLARMFAYAPQVAALLPLVLNEAVRERYEPLMALSRLLSGTIGDQITQGVQLSVICTEDAGELAANPADADTLLGNALIESLQAQCPVWPTGDRPAGFREPLSGDVLVLLLSGEFDPVTPPRYGDEVAATLSNSRHLIVRGQGHNVLPIGCVPRLFAGFLESADGKALDATCLESVPYAPPFSGFYGWEP